MKRTPKQLTPLQALRGVSPKRKPKSIRGRTAKVHVERNAQGQIESIIGSCHPGSCARVDLEHVARRKAVGEIRRRCFDRSGGICECEERCGKRVTWHGGQLHERKHRGDTSGEGAGRISMDNSIFIRRGCHDKAHASRNPQWAKKTA